MGVPSEGTIQNSCFNLQPTNAALPFPPHEKVKSLNPDLFFHQQQTTRENDLFFRERVFHRWQFPTLYFKEICESEV
jgi:hypothetical protein